MLRKSCRFNGSCKVMLICIYSPNNKSRLRAASCGVFCVSHLPLSVTHSTNRFICIRNFVYFYFLVSIFCGSFVSTDYCFDIRTFKLFFWKFRQIFSLLNNMTPCNVIFKINIIYYINTKWVRLNTKDPRTLLCTYKTFHIKSTYTHSNV